MQVARNTAFHEVAVRPALLARRELGILKQVINAPDYQAAIGLLSVPRLDSKFPD